MEARPGEPSPGELTGSVLALQRTAGNRAVTGLIGAGSPAVARAGADDGVKGAVRGMETLFGADFSDVALEESREASDIGAEAFTFGNRITFAPGRADVSSGDGRKLLAHELAHVIQQRAGRVPKARQGRGSEVLNLDAGLEAEAETAAAAAAAGNAVTVAGGSGRLPVALAEPPATQGFVPQVVLGAGREVGKGALKRLAAHGVAAGINANMAQVMAELGPKLAERVQGAVQRAAQSPEVQAAMKNLKDTAQQLDFARQVATALSGAAADYMTEHVAALFEGLAEQLPYKEEIQRARTTVAKLLHVDLVSSVWAGMKAGLAHIAQSQAMQMFEGWAAGRMREASTTALDVLVGKVGGEIAPLREQFDNLVASAAEPLEQVKKISDAVVISPLQKLGKHGVDMVMGGEPTLDTKAWAAQGASVFGQQEGKLLMEAREKVAEQAGAESLVSLDNFLIAMKLASDMRKLEKVKEGHEVVSILLKAFLETGATVVTAGLGKKTLLTAVAKVAGVKTLEQLLDPVSRSVWDATLDLATHEDRDDGLMLPQQDRAIAQATVLFVCALPVVARFASPVTERLAKVAALPGTVASYAGGQAARFAGAAASTAASAFPDGGPISPFGRALGSAGSWLSSFGGTGAAPDPAASGPEQTVTIDAKELAAVIEEWESEVIQAVAPGAGASQPKATSRGDDWQI